MTEFIANRTMLLPSLPDELMARILAEVPFYAPGFWSLRAVRALKECSRHFHRLVYSEQFQLERRALPYHGLSIEDVVVWQAVELDAWLSDGSMRQNSRYRRRTLEMPHQGATWEAIENQSGR